MEALQAHPATVQCHCVTPCADSGGHSHHYWLQVGDVRQLTSQVLAQLLVGQRLDVYVVEYKVRLL